MYALKLFYYVDRRALLIIVKGQRKANVNFYTQTMYKMSASLWRISDRLGKSLFLSTSKITVSLTEIEL